MSITPVLNTFVKEGVETGMDAIFADNSIGNACRSIGAAVNRSARTATPVIPTVVG
jgi:hypothetical protein